MHSYNIRQLGIDEDKKKMLAMLRFFGSPQVDFDHNTCICKDVTNFKHEPLKLVNSRL